MNILHNSSSDGVPKEAYGVNETDVDSLMQVTEGEVMLPPVTATASKILDPCCHIDNMTPEADSRKICEYLGADDHPNVRLLSMAFNAVENLDFIWPERFSNLRILNLTFNKLVNIDAIECIPSLKILRCTSNKLLEIPSASTFSQLTCLEEFWVNRNKLINLEDAVVSLSAAQSLKKLVLCKNPCCKTSIDALYFHYVVANLEHLENLDGTKVTMSMKKKGIDYISSLLGQNLVQQMAQRGRASGSNHPYGRRPRSQPKSARRKVYRNTRQSISCSVLKKEVKKNVVKGATDQTPDSKVLDTNHDFVETDETDDHGTSDSGTRKSISCPLSVDAGEKCNAISNEMSDKEKSEIHMSTKDIADEIGFESISSMLPSFSSSKLAASNTRKTRAARPSKFRNPVRNTMRTKKAKGKHPSALTEEKRYKSLGLSSTSTQILRENRSANNSRGNTKLQSSIAAAPKEKKSSQAVRNPNVRKNPNRSKRISSAGKTKVSITSAVKQPTPLPKSLMSWEDGKAENTVDFSTISSLLPDLSSKLASQRKDRTKRRPRKKKSGSDDGDDIVYHSEYMRNKGRKKVK